VGRGSGDSGVTVLVVQSSVVLVITGWLFVPLFTSLHLFLFSPAQRNTFCFWGRAAEILGICQQKATQIDCILFSRAAKLFGICRQKS
jgi:hypothetical protein